MAHRIATFPPVIALVLVLALRPLSLAPALDQALARIGDTLAPLALGLSYKLVLAPALVVTALWLAGAAPDTTTQVSVIEAAMPPMIGAGIVAAQANLAPRLVSLMVGVGIPLGLMTACGWHWFFGRLVA